MLHIISQSPVEYAVLDRIDMGDQVLFIENAVLSLMDGGRLTSNLIQLQKKARLFILAPDLETRGIDNEKLVAGIELIEYTGFVELTVQNKVIHSWC